MSHHTHFHMFTGLFWICFFFSEVTLTMFTFCGLALLALTCECNYACTGGWWLLNTVHHNRGGVGDYPLPSVKTERTAGETDQIRRHNELPWLSERCQKESPQVLCGKYAGLGSAAAWLLRMIAFWKGRFGLLNTWIYLIPLSAVIV